MLTLWAKFIILSTPLLQYLSLREAFGAFFSPSITSVRHQAQLPG